MFNWRPFPSSQLYLCILSFLQLLFLISVCPDIISAPIEAQKGTWQTATFL